MITAAWKALSVLGAAAVATTTATYYATTTNTGTVTTPNNAAGSTAGTWTADTGKTNWTHEWQMDGGAAVVPSGQQSLTIRARKDATGGGTPTIDSIEIRDPYNTTTIQTVSTGWSIDSATGQDVTITFNAPSDGAIGIRVATSGHGGGPNGRAVQLDYLRWDAVIEA